MLAFVGLCCDGETATETDPAVDVEASSETETPDEGGEVADDVTDVPTDSEPDSSTDVGTDLAEVETTDAPEAETSEDDGNDADAPEVLHVPHDEACENLTFGHCVLPWPSDRYLVPDEERATGYRLAYESAAVPVGRSGEPFDTEPYEFLDGFSPSSQVLTIFDEPVDLSNAATVDNPDRSLEPDSPTLLIDLETGELIAHWVENDARADAPDETVFYLRPMIRLEHNHGYAVVIRDLRGVSGELLEPSVTFAALRDGRITDVPDLEATRERGRASRVWAPGAEHRRTIPGSILWTQVSPQCVGDQDAPDRPTSASDRSPHDLHGGSSIS